MITSQTAEIAEAEKTLKELRRTVQSLEINLDSMRNLVRVLTSPAPTTLGPTLCPPQTQSYLSPNPTPFHFKSLMLRKGGFSLRFPTAPTHDPSIWHILSSRRRFRE